MTKAGWDRQARQLYCCRACGRRRTTRSGSDFSGDRFPDAVIALAVRHALRYRLRYADVCEWLAERGVSVDPSTVDDGVRTFTPRFVATARAQRAAVGTRGRVDETSLTIGKRWHDRYRAIDAHGQIVAVYLRCRRNAAAAQAFFEGAIDETGVTPTRVPTDTAAAYRPAIRAVVPATGYFLYWWWIIQPSHHLLDSSTDRFYLGVELVLRLKVCHENRYDR